MRATNEKNDYLLGPYRALDLTDEKGFLCGRMLGDLGVDVIKVEPPGGDPSRSIGPFYHDIPHAEKSLYWFAFNANKRGITLNIETVDGQEIFKRLVKNADFVIESFTPGYMENLGLGYPVLSEINPGIIITSITPFGQTGPYANYKASDLAATAMSGYLYLCGDPDRPPVRISFPQSFLHAAIEAAVGTMIAHYHRESTGEGQWVDTSMQESLAMNTLEATSHWEVNQTIVKRQGAFRFRAHTGARQRHSWPCKDGYVCYTVIGGRMGAQSMRATVAWMDSEGMADDLLKNTDWDTLDFNNMYPETLDRLEKPIGRFFMTHTKAELFEEAIKRRIHLYPVATVKDIVESPQLAARNFWVELEHPEPVSTILYPGVFAKASETPCRIRYRAPLVGEHNNDIYIKELNLSTEELCALRQGGII